MIVRTSVLLLLVAALPIVLSGQQPAGPAGGPNPLLTPWTTPFGVPPFGDIKPEHFLPAIKAGIAQQRQEIEAIANNPQPPTFANTLEAMENAGELLSTVSPVFSNMQSSNTTEQLQAINREVAPLLTALRDDIRLNPALFARVKALWDARASLEVCRRCRPGCSTSSTRASSAAAPTCRRNRRSASGRSTASCRPSASSSATTCCTTPTATGWSSRARPT